MEYYQTETKFTFSKKERLKGKTSADILFSKGKTLFDFPFKFFYTLQPHIADSVNQILIAVPKRTFKKAVDRNNIKRQIREAYRKNKAVINSVENKYHIAIVYVAKEKLPFTEIEKKLILVLSKLSKKI
jgi:ribonuclease P protein component